jgi:phage shock protein E
MNPNEPNEPERMTTMSILARLFSREPATAPTSSAAVAGGVPMELDAADFLRRRTADAPVLDVRTPGEFAGGHLRGARNVNLMDPDFAGAVDRLGLDRSRPVYLYCRSGNRSGQAARILRDRGYTAAVNVGGLDELVQEGGEFGR